MSFFTTLFKSPKVTGSPDESGVGSPHVPPRRDQKRNVPRKSMGGSKKKAVLASTSFLSDRWVEDSVAFWCTDGRVFHSLAELRDNVGQLSRDVFSHHSNAEKCDFATWARDVFGHSDFADQLYLVRTDQKKVANALKERIR